ncbi:hypothetical protein TGAM01_v200501 [Trichoderma gamsii]|uniref:Structure-specific endonuclease subunit SLX4 n=1 Tax=Trichoderma gamsii TaxID=398673 RepID=A0A2P5A3G9_9HYPO|nr:hypothetical protein TGAM01_v200501 [Trichoderma gamsii]PON31081.1 hypothetical protein TGAM01_v200501 [Trichoderma gamsii]
MMASPNAFLPSPSRSARQTSHFFRSSSPDLPFIGDILSPGVRIRPPTVGDKTLVISSDEESAIKGRDKKKRSKNLTAGPTPSISNRSGTADDGDSSLCIIEPPATHTPVAQRNHVAPPRFRSQSSSPTKDQPWKKFKSKADNSHSDSPEVREPESGDIRTISTPRPASNPPPIVQPNSKRDINDIKEPLRLEPAMVRRLDWTPPSNKSSTIHEVQSSSAIKDTHSPELQEADKNFEQILEAYKCADSLQQNVSAPGEGANVLGKRKLLEMVVTTAAPAAVSTEVEEKAPVKQKAPRKRPRTITELATSAYRRPDPLQPVPAAVNDSTITITHNDTDDTAAQEESKKKTKRKTTKAAAKKKKKPSPPSPILLAPAEALQEVARQDFVFGTSSQLAIENSPTFLRDLQAAMRRSNRVDYVNLDSPLNDDGIELPERKRLWAAGARDIDGDLFDLEINKIMERSSQPLPALDHDEDPFGYVGGDTNITLPAKSGVGAQTGLPSSPLINTNEVLPNGAKPIEINDGSVLAGGGIPVESPQRQVSKPADGTQSFKTHEPRDPSNPDHTQPHSSKPSFELFTDAQLSKKVASYGFKAIKSRQAKISLLEQCWQSKSSIQQPNSTRNVTTSAATEKSTLDNSVRTPRGRPRKNSASSTPEIQEPPPSAQPPVSPSKPRGRPKKSVTAAKRITAGPSKGKKASPKASIETPTAQKRKPKATKVIVEIPDSASDSEHSLSPDPASSPGLPFSQPRVDLSTSVMDDTDLNLSGDQSLGYEYITKAVQSAPRTTDPRNPSWHEKILLYDPIVLEDFTTWLNCGQLTRVGFDGEVSTMEVKQWCESKSICCLWKVNLRGKERKRY